MDETQLEVAAQQQPTKDAQTGHHQDGPTDKDEWDERIGPQPGHQLDQEGSGEVEGQDGRDGERELHGPSEMILAGTPPTVAPSGTSWVTTAPAATRQPAPIVTPAVTVTCAPNQVPRPIRIAPYS